MTTQEEADHASGSAIQTITLRRPDDMHLHLRDGAMLTAVAPVSAEQFARAVIMPNLQPPVRTAADAITYRTRILAALPQRYAARFQPLMTLYLTDITSVEDIIQAKRSEVVVACKLYPAGITTNSAMGVTDIAHIYPVLEAMQKEGLILCIHGEAIGEEIDIFDREEEFVKCILPTILESFPTLKVILEHVTTKAAADVVRNTPGNRLAATITPHHLLYSRQAIFEGAKIHPHMFCLPVLKRETHRKALLEAVASDTEGKFFAGTDSAPHPRNSKLCESGCAGIFNAICAVELYAEAFEEAGALNKLQAFMSENGARFYGLELNEEYISLVRRSKAIPSTLAVDSSEPVIPLRAGGEVIWSIF